MKWLVAIVFLFGCCPEPDYTGWKRVENPFYEDSITDSVWVYVGSEDYWIGNWEGKTYIFQIITDTLFIKQKE